MAFNFSDWLGSKRIQTNPFQGALAGYAIYFLVAWIYIAFMRIATGGAPDTYLPFVWPFTFPFLIFRYTWEGHLDENLLILLGGLLMISGALWGYLGFPTLQNRNY